MRTTTMDTMFKPRQYFEEHETDRVRGFIILEASEVHGTYRIAEKVSNGPLPATWSDYIIPHDKLVERMDAGLCEPKVVEGTTDIEGRVSPAALKAVLGQIRADNIKRGVKVAPVQ